VVAADRAGLTQSQLRQLFRAVQRAHADLKAESAEDPQDPN